MITEPLRHFVPYDDLGDTPNIVVDGAGNAATAITLSHWPKSGTPKALKADTSAEIVFNYLDSPEFHVTATAVSNNHFDEDGLAGLYALTEPQAAIAMRDLVIAVAEAGDFGRASDRWAARIAFTISAFANPDCSPLSRAIFALPYSEKCAALYRELLPRLGEMMADPGRFEEYWVREDQALADSERAMERGDVTIEERRDVDLAIVRIAEGRTSETARGYSWPAADGCHSMAINNVTNYNRILVQQGRRYVFGYRYESWVQITEKPPLPRADLAPLAEGLTRDEPGAAEWRFDGVSDIKPRLRLSGATESAIPPDVFAARLEEFLATAPPAWDPYDP